ncbi:MAG: putative glycosyltransferase [Phormidesmis priestleyi Ana]|uniref:Putative glycosyltransferase n=1 Tax=Phormidesmis priestleyi Ana TaxID=1666911 RepID=A0A0P7ZBK7_9CYAN|nr:MAG: putative glycosyltransferase [Phormidesmis priestleyi Ana]
MNKISVLTLTRNRTDHLQNLLKGLALSSRLPDECIVIHMNEPAEVLGDWPFPCEHSTYENSDALLPLPKARNAAAHRASGNLLLFLDVDCIPAEKMVAEYEKACEERPDAIAMGNVHYLSKKITIDWTEDSLKTKSAPHPKRDITQTASLAKEENYGLFWSLSFAISRSLFEQLDGFSERYSNYGAEDTDFAWKARAAGIDLCWVPKALAFHQFHTSEVPPWHNFKSIVYNAQVFYERWGEWPMGGWLKVFAAEGYIDWAIEGDYLKVIRLPQKA